MQIIAPALTFVDGVFEPNLHVQVDDAGRIVRVAPAEGAPTLELGRRALLPGMVNAHSHAFQRGLRGMGESFPDGAGSFWSWREAMYRLVRTMDPNRCYELSRRAFREMLAGGTTTVGEFHYLHHRPGTMAYELDDAVLRAAKDTGIRLVLLYAFYERGGFDAPLDDAQASFRVPSRAAYWDRMDELTARLDPATQTLGVVAHSIRAASIEDIAALHEEAEKRAMVFHMHVEEQPKEVADCVHHYHKTPMALLNERLRIGPRFTAVHCTHTAIADMEDFLEAGGNVCICPLTEANLGDGLADLPHVLRNGGRVCLGSDSNARICLLEEMRWLEYGQRLRTQSRGVFADAAGRLAPALWAAATVNGAHALGLRAGAIAPGRHADFMTIDLDDLTVAGWTDETLLDALICGAGNAVVREVCVGGRWLGSGRRRP